MESHRIHRPAFLGQVPLNSATRSTSVEIDRPSAQYGDTVIHLLRSLPETDLEIVAVNCWRELMLVSRGQVDQLAQRLIAFLESESKTLTLSAEQYQVFDKVLSCGKEIEESEDIEQGASIQHIAAMVGIAGGLAALITLL